MEKENRNSIIRIAAAAVLLAAAYVIEKATDLPMWGSLLLYSLPYLTVGWDVLAEAAEGIAHGEVLDEDFLMSIATIGALCIGFLPGAEPMFAEAVFVMLFFKVGELFEEIAEGNSRKSISQLMDIRPDSANVERDGVVVTVAPEAVEVGETIVIRPGEKVPMDGVIIEGSSTLNTVALTGESAPLEVMEGDNAMSGCVNCSGVLRVRVSKAFSESTASRILELVENAAERKSSSESFISRFARIYTPVVVAAALLIAFVPPVISGSFAQAFAPWLTRALTFLVVSCPCALVISVPLTFFGGIGAASKAGILIKGSSFIDTLARVRTVVFDKTGTLTKGVFEVTAVHPEAGISSEELLSLAASAEQYSTHPIAVSLRNACPEGMQGNAESVEEVAGHGIRAVADGKRLCVGNARMMAAEGISTDECPEPGTIVHISVDGNYAGHIVISDRVKDDASEAVASLKAAGVERAVMLTGDRKEMAAYVAGLVGMDSFHAELLPEDKVNIVETLLSEEGSLAFVGDGINDAPVLARADIGIAMGAMGSDAAIEAADVVIMDDKPSKIAKAVRIARRTISIAKQNIVSAIGVKILVLILAALGVAAMWMAVFADVGVTVLAVLNATRAMKVR